MAVRPFLTLISGVQTLVNAIIASTGAADANKIIATNADGRIDPSFLPGIKTFEADEALAAGDFVNIYNNSGAKVRKASGSGAIEAHGFVLSAYLATETAEVYLVGTNDAAGVFPVGSKIWLSTTTAGAATNVAPAITDGHIVQVLGYATSATSDIEFTYDPAVLINLTI